MARRSVSVTTQTPTATADTTALVDATYPFLLRGGTSTQRNGIWEIYIAGQAASTSSPTYMVLGVSSTVGTGANSMGAGQNDAPLDVLSAPDSNPALTGNTNATIDPQRSSTLKLLNLSLNAYGGITKWQTHDALGRVLIYGNAATTGEVTLSAFTGGTPGALGSYMIYESQ
jgi:hypothetical protein